LTGCASLSQNKKVTEEGLDLNAQLEQALAKIQTLEKEKNALALQNTDLLKSKEESDAQYKDVLSQLKDEVQDGQVKLTQYKNMLSVDVAEKLFFNSGSAKLKKEGKAMLSKVGAALNQYGDKYIRVVGHTDNVPLRPGSAYATNWELSVSRATNVVRFLEKMVDPKRLVASGRGEHDPVASNDTPEGRQKNRRIELLLIDKNLFESTQPSAEKAEEAPKDVPAAEPAVTPVEAPAAQ
jgi:chemotaxis protein MotB